MLMRSALRRSSWRWWSSRWWPSGRRVLVGGLEQRLDGEVRRVTAVEFAPEPELDDRAGVEAARARGGEVLLLVAAAGHVVLEQPAEAPAGVVAGEQRHHRQALHGGREVVADHLAELVGLALEGEGGVLDLLVVLELELEQLDHLEGGAGGARDRHAGVPIGGEHLLHRAMADQVPPGGPPGTPPDHTLGVTDGDDRRAVRSVDPGAGRQLTPP